MTNLNQYVNENTVNVTDIIFNADKLFDKQQDFEARTNNELYHLLSGIYSLYLNAKEIKRMEDVVKEMKIKLKKAKVTTQATTPDLTVFVRYIYRTDRKKAYNYSKVLELADKKLVKVEEFVNFIKNTGGIEACKSELKILNGGKTDEDDLKNRVSQLKEMKPSASVMFNTLFEDSGVDLSDAPSESDNYVLVLARASKSGTLDLLKIVPDKKQAMLTSAIKKIDFKADDSITPKEATTDNVQSSTETLSALDQAFLEATSS